MSALLELAERVEAATGPDRELDRDIASAVHLKQLTYSSPEWIKDPEFTASIDAAMTLVPEGWTRTVKWSVENEGYALVYDPAVPDDSSIYALGKTAALALCAAALRAHASGETE